MEFKNDLGLVGKIAAHSVMSGKYKDKDGNIKEILPVGPGNSLDFDQFREDIGAFGGTDVDEKHPSVGIDYFAGDFEKGEITERNILYNTSTNPTTKTNISFLDDVGPTMNRVGTGLQFFAHLQKTSIKNGIVGETTTISFYYDPKNVYKSGGYTTTTPVPIYTKASSYEVDKPNTITFDGIGENLKLSNHKSPGLVLTFKSDKTMDVEPIQGFDNDGAADGVTGYTYDVIIDLISTYGVQPAVGQLPSDILVFEGNATDEIALNGVNEYFANVSGIEITLSDKAVITSSNLSSNVGEAYRASDFGIKKEYILKRPELACGYKINLAEKTPVQTGRVSYNDSLTLNCRYVSPFIEVNSKSISIPWEVNFDSVPINHGSAQIGTLKLYIEKVKIIKGD